MSNNYTFGIYIRDLREKKKLSQAELGQLIGVSNKAVSKWETGAAYPSSEYIFPLAKALDVSVEELYRMMSEDKKKPSALRKLIDKMCSYYKIEVPALFGAAVLFYIIFAIFSTQPDKELMLVLAPLASICACGMLFLIFYIFRKNPMCSSDVIDVFIVIFFACFTLTSVTSSIGFILNIKQGFDFQLVLSFCALASLVIIQKTRKK